ncbi:dystrobrevin beta isoform X2 [Cotesia glomerata]|uniref:dystrobrevin beta isoform X2 n=1 Tax=Cotesia glomerata TaxID=32391 RepID=UPI001D01DFAD|nr:dystrobrevin beta isoform X2 [Cotesia glomerata]
MMEDEFDRKSSDHNNEASILQLSQEMQEQNFDSIRFASYRTACKLRFIQKKVHLHDVDIWNVIEAFRENGLNTLEPSYMLSVSRLETLLSSVFHALNKRVPVSQQCKVDSTTALLMNWLLVTYMSGEANKITVLSVKVALSTLCAGKLIDKFRYIYSQISDNNGHMIHWKFSEFLKEILSLPAAVYETPSFPYSEDLSNSIIPSDSKVTVNNFLDIFMSDSGPHCLIWLPLYHRIANVESVHHPVMCDACYKSNFSGFRYRCQKCNSYQLCQDCFWRGKVSGGHTNDHETREYSSFKSPSKQIGHSLRKSFRCVPEKEKNCIPRFPEQPERTLDLSHIVPPSPLPSHNGFQESGFNTSFDAGSMDSRSTAKSFDCSRYDDEHKLIAKYAHRLAQETKTVHGKAPLDTNSTPADASQTQRELIIQLELKNKEIMLEIARLRKHQEIETSGVNNPVLMTELRALRSRKDELETHLASLQDSRKHLMIQLEEIMRTLKVHDAIANVTSDAQAVADWAKDHGLEINLNKTSVMLLGTNSKLKMIQRETLPPIIVNSVALPYADSSKCLGLHVSSNLSWNLHVSKTNQHGSPNSTPNSSPRSARSPLLPQGGMMNSRSAPSTPGSSIVTPQQQDSQEIDFSSPGQSFQNQTVTLNPQLNILVGVQQSSTPDNLACVGGDVRSAFRTNSLPDSGSSSANNTLSRSLRNDLLVAADSVTNAMSTLVRELNSDLESKVIENDNDAEVNFQHDDL